VHWLRLTGRSCKKRFYQAGLSTVTYLQYTNPRGKVTPADKRVGKSHRLAWRYSIKQGSSKVQSPTTSENDTGT